MSNSYTHRAEKVRKMAQLYNTVTICFNLLPHTHMILFAKFISVCVLSTLIDPTPWNRVLLEKLIVTQLSRNSLPFMECDGSLPCSQQPITGTIPSQMNTVHTFPPPPIHYNNILSSSKLSISFMFSTKIQYAFLINLMLHALPTLSSLI
jgi:hypothetical protein